MKLGKIKAMLSAAAAKKIAAANKKAIKQPSAPLTGLAGLAGALGGGKPRNLMTEEQYNAQLLRDKRGPGLQTHDMRFGDSWGGTSYADYVNAGGDRNKVPFSGGKFIKGDGGGDFRRGDSPFDRVSDILPTKQLAMPSQVTTDDILNERQAPVDPMLAAPPVEAPAPIEHSALNLTPPAPVPDLVEADPIPATPPAPVQAPSMPSQVTSADIVAERQPAPIVPEAKPAEEVPRFAGGRMGGIINKGPAKHIFGRPSIGKKPAIIKPAINKKIEKSMQITDAANSFNNKGIGGALGGVAKSITKMPKLLNMIKKKKI